MTRAGLVAWTTFGLSVAAMVAAVVIWAIGAREPLTADIVLYPLAYLAFGAIGALIVSRHPANTIGRLSLVTGAVGTAAGLADSWARVARPLPGQDLAAWLTTWGFPVSLAPPLFVILLFPTGRFASPRWRVVAWMIVAGAALVAIGNAFSPIMVDHPDRVNPFGVAGFQGSLLESGGAGWLPLLAGAVLAALGLVPRLRRATGVERQQLKWITYAAALQVAAWIWLALDLKGLAGELAMYAVFLTLALIPISAGIAILRYRLYEIDVVIRRTVVYGAVVGILAIVYLALILALQAALAGITGGGTLPVALSTLAIAGLFGPVRTRVRELVDRRFYRSRYDAQRTMETFAAQLRDEVELEQLTAALSGVVIRNLRPAGVSLWIRARRGSP